jgi:hypothetical protein
MAGHVDQADRGIPRIHHNRQCGRVSQSGEREPGASQEREQSTARDHAGGLDGCGAVAKAALFLDKKASKQFFFEKKKQKTFAL